MSSELLYLREDVYLEPLLHNWYVWPYLIPPVSCAMNFTGRNMRLMKSFVSNHLLHIAASHDRSLTGGDFVNCSENQVDEVRALITEIETTYADYFEVRKAVTQLNNMLEQESGMGMEGLYASIPHVLRGYVELVYDMNHHASFRLIEGLLYSGSLYKEAGQSILLGSLSRVKIRPFVLSSPRFSDANHIEVKLPFADPLLDTLFSLRTTPAARSDVEALFLGKQIKGGVEISDLFTATPPRRVHHPVTDALRVRYLGHSGLLLETKDVAILVDPVIPCVDDDERDKIVSFAELPDVIDYICLTHTHMDHVCIETLLQLRYKTKRVLVPKNNGGSIVDPSIKLMLQKLGFDAYEFEDFEEVKLGAGKIKAIPFLGEHADLHIRSKTAWYFELGGKKIFAGADSSSLDEHLYARVYEDTGDLDMLFIGMECVGAPMSWLYGALFTKPVPRAVNESRRFNGSDFVSAQKLVRIFKPKSVYIYALGMEPWFKYFMGVEYTADSRQIQESSLLMNHCAMLDIQSEQLFSRREWHF